MAVERELLASLREFEDPGLGIRERMLTPVIGGGRTVAVLSLPLGTVTQPGWVICGSYGTEHEYLMRFEVALARGLAARGFPVIRYHGQGYGDSELSFEQTTAASHLEDAVAAVHVLRGEAGLTRVGLMGARFGATTAVLAASATGAEAIAAVEPVVRGRGYVRAVLMRSRVSELAGSRVRRSSGSADETQTMDLDVDATIDVEGLPVRTPALRGIQGLDVLAPAQAFDGRSLVVGISRSGDPSADTRALAEALGLADGRASMGVETSPMALRFGLPTRPGLDIEGLLALERAAVDRIVSWAGA